MQATPKKRAGPADKWFVKSKPITLIVRRGALRRFDRLKRDTADLDVDVIWDRRGAERKGAAAGATVASQKGDRRKRPPFTWEAADFVVTDKGRSHPRPKKP